MLNISDDAELFDYSVENNVVQITLTRTLTPNDIDGKINFVFILTASNAIGNSDRTIIIVNVPEINCAGNYYFSISILI